MIGKERKTDLRDDVDALGKALGEVTAGVRVLVEHAEQEARAWHQLGGDVPCRQVLINTGDAMDPRSARNGVSVHWTPAGLLVYVDGKRMVTSGVQMVFETVPSMQRWR